MICCWRADLLTAAGRATTISAGSGLFATTDEGLRVLLTRHSIEIRVRYCETDAMRILHHSSYLNYFELGRTELFRAQGCNYRRMEDLGLYFVVVKFQIHYRRSAIYDDLLTLHTAVTRTTPARIVHDYELLRDAELLCTAQSTIACVDRDGQPQRVPENLPELTGGG